MLTEQELRKAVEEILREMSADAPVPASPPREGNGGADKGDALPDLGAQDPQEIVRVPHPHNPGAMRAMKKTTPARIGVWRAGPRYLTETLLRFRADHAVAMDAVFTDVSEEWIKEHGFAHFKSLCSSKDEYLTRPDLGRFCAEEDVAKIKAHVGGNNRVVVFVADGLSTTAVTVNAPDTLKAIADGLARHNIKPCAPFFVQYGRVGVEDHISEITGAEVVCALIGERPGLITAESMSAYMAYKAVVDMPEARRTVISNIHGGGTPAVEAGAYIADIIKTILDKKASGLDLKL
ncbi:MAG: ethanolamine ammonia-lyase subunit EutC [Desulfovibrio sp.]|jgi:ethanolamine ammonia-lyase small subunit|nr:ethanolamine ammonia-lyase subunit EutC [Desulfovibrio sp.]